MSYKGYIDDISIFTLDREVTKQEIKSLVTNLETFEKESKKTNVLSEFAKIVNCHTTGQLDIATELNIISCVLSTNLNKNILYIYKDDKLIYTKDMSFLKPNYS